MGFYYWTGRYLARFCFSTFGRWKVEGKEAVPPKGPLIVVSNHLSTADPPILVASVPRRLKFIGKRSLFDNLIGSAVLTGLGVYPVGRGEGDLIAVRRCLELLAQDHPLVLFPEGRRSFKPGMNKAEPGVAYIAARSQAPILPIAITGTEHIGGARRLVFPFCRITVRIGDPFSLPVLDGKLSRPLLESLANMIMQRVADQLPPEYRGYYAIQGTKSGV